MRIRWHGTVVREAAALAKFTGAKVEIEPAVMMLQSSHRPGLVVHADRNSSDGIVDVRTALAALQGSCLGAAATAGHAAAQAATAKELKWRPQAQAQGLRFFVIEDGGFLGDGARDFFDFIAARMGGPSPSATPSSPTRSSVFE